MKFRKSKGLDSECYVRSQGGVWIKGELTDDGVELFWQVRTSVNRNKVIVYDANGDVDYEMDRRKVIYPPSMKSAGIIPIGDDFVELCGDDKYEEGICAVMRHAAHMTAAGYGDSPEHVVELLSDLRSANFANGVSYRFLKGCCPFDELEGLEGSVNVVDDGKMYLDIVSLGEGYSTEIDTEKDLISFMISSVPI